MATALVTDELMPLDVGSLVSLAINSFEPLPALVAAADERSFTLQTASRPGCRVGDRAVVGWSIGGELHELRTRVVRGFGMRPSSSFSRHGIITRTGDRRGVARFVLVAGGSLLLDDREVSGSRTTSRSTAWASCSRARRRRSARAAGLEVHDALGVLLPRATVRVMHTSETKQPGVARVGLAFDDPERVAGATGRLLALLARPTRRPRAARRGPARSARSSSGARIAKSQPSPRAPRPSSRARRRACAAASARRPAPARRASAGAARPPDRPGRSSSTSTSHVHGTRASERLTWATASNPSGGAIAAWSARPPRVMRSTRNVRRSARPWS